MTREELIEVIIQETATKAARKLGARKLKNYASVNIIRTYRQSKNLGVKLAKRRQRNRARGYERMSMGQVAAAIHANAKK